ncbi:MAG TPA: acetylxylan esterase [Planctomycetota bacterium]|nr:acetylxylan esterase [Planctomycetota bacterium]
MHIEDLENASPAHGYYDVREQLRKHICRRSEAAFLRGDASRDAIKSKADVEARQKFIREHVIKSLGGLPSMDTPLQAKTVGETRGNGFRVENVIYQSRPNVYVTANLYIPDNIKGKTGAVLFVCGHAREAKTYPQYQIVCQHFALAGLVVLAQDPVGQGERLSYWDSRNNRSEVEWGTSEHDHVGAQCLPLGWSLARFFVHDSMRAIDYLASRPEVDAAKIGVTGNSGGGTQTSLMMLCDPRIAAAAPGTFIMSRQTYMEAGGAQDAEQIWPEFSSAGLDHEDILLAVCPKPVKVLACRSDFFPIEGARRTVQRVQRFWELYGRAGDVGIAEDDVLHAYTPKLAKASTAMFSKALLGREVEIDDAKIKVFPHHELWCGKSGYIQHEIPGAVAVFEAVKTRADELKRARQAFPADERRKRAIEWLKKKVFDNRKPCELNPRFYREGDYDCEGLHALAAMWWSQEGMFTGGYLFRKPSDVSKKVPVTLALWDRGTRHLQRHWGFIEQTCNAGRAVLVLDVSGVGAFLPNRFTYTGPEDNFGAVHKLACDLIFLDDDLASMRVFDTIRALDMIESWRGLDSSDIRVYAHGRDGFYGRVAKALDPRIKSVEVVKGETISDWVTLRLYEKQGIYGVALRGALEYFDLDEL